MLLIRRRRFMIGVIFRAAASIALIAAELSCCPDGHEHERRQVAEQILARMEAGQTLTEDENVALARMAQSRCHPGDIWSICARSPASYHPLLAEIALMPGATSRSRENILAAAGPSLRDRTLLWSIY